jgi:hypothetical protein
MLLKFKSRHCRHLLACKLIMCTFLCCLVEVKMIIVTETTHTQNPHFYIGVNVECYSSEKKDIFMQI